MKDPRFSYSDATVGALATAIVLLFLLPAAGALSGLLWGLCGKAWVFAAGAFMK
jgi:hypothetical protein